MPEIVSFEELTGGAAPAPAPKGMGMHGNLSDDEIGRYIKTESGGNPNAVSPKGAEGLMQVMPTTQTDPGFGVKPAKDHSPAELKRVGVDYLSAMKNRYKDRALTAIAYNMGPGATDKWLARGGDWRDLPEETKKYVKSVGAGRGFAQIPQDQSKKSGVDIVSFDELTGKAPPKSEEKFRGQRLLMNAAAAGDVAWGYVSQTLGLAGNAATYATAIAQGKTHKEATTEGRQASDAIQGVIGQPIERLLNHFAPGSEEAYKDSTISKAMDKVTSWLDKGIDNVVKKTDGKVSREDAETIRDWLMVMGPVGMKKVVGSVLKKGAEEVKPSTENLDKYVKKAEEGQPSVSEVVGMPEAPKPEPIGKTPLPPPEKPPQAPIGQDVGTVAKTRLTEGTELGKKPGPAPSPQPIETGAPAPLDSGLAKVKSGRAFDLTAEERIALRKDSTSSRIIAPETRQPKSATRSTNTPSESPRPYNILEDDAQTMQRLNEVRKEIEQLTKSREDAHNAGKLSREERISSAVKIRDLKEEFAQLNSRADRLSRQTGKVDPELLAKVGLTTAGALIASHYADEDKLEAAISGGLVGLAATKAPDYARAVARDWKGTLGTTASVAGVTGGFAYLDKDHPIEGAMMGLLWGSTKALPKANVMKVGQLTADDLINMRNGAVAASARETHNVSDSIRLIVPDAARREQLADIIEEGKVGTLTGNDLRAAQAFRGFMDSYGQAAKNAGVLQDFVENYVTHIVERENLPRTKIQETMDALFGTGEKKGGFQPNTRFAKERKYATFSELQNALAGSDLKLKTKDIADIIDNYGRSMGKAIENKTLLNSLEAAKQPQPGGSPYIMPVKDAPASYKTINNSQMRGMAVHPELADPLKFVMENDDPGAIRAGLTALSTAQKRLAVSGSLFHASNLINAYIGANGLNSLRGAKPINAALQAFRNGGAGDVVDTLIRGGLKLETPMEYQPTALATVGSMADHLVDRLTGVNKPVFEKTLGSLEKIQKQTFDKLTWDYLHTGMKLATAMRAYEKLTLKNPKMPKEEVARQVASFTNDTFGGLDWYRVATETQSQLARKIALNALNPKGRSILQIGMFAPDWTMSTFRSLYKALPGSTSMPLTQRLHQHYALRTGLIYATLMNGYNMTTSGHPIWDNKDPTKIEYADGTTQQVAKHAMEGAEWLHNPRRTALHKLGFAVKTPAELLFGKEYLSETGQAPPIQSRTAHILNEFAPIPLQQDGTPGRTTEEMVKRAALGVVGLPVYNMTAEEKAAAKKERASKPKKKKATQ